MTKTARRLAALSAPALLVLSLTACGGGDGSGAPEDASKEDFCKAYEAEPEFDAAGLQDASPEEQAKAIKDALDELVDNFAEVGTPEDIPDDAREGFEISIDKAGDLSQDDIEKAIKEKDEDFLDADVSGDDKEKVDAFDDWARDYC